MACPICGANCRCRKRGEDGRCCSCHKHKARTPAQAAAHQEHDRKTREAGASPIVDLLAELGLPEHDKRYGFTYPGLFDRPVVTDLVIIRGGAVPVVIATERADNPGASITNTIERLAAALSREKGWLPGRDFALVEHYPPRGGDRAGSIDHLPRSIDRVEFDTVMPTGTWKVTGALVNGPKWTHLGIEGLRALIQPALVSQL